MDFNNLYLFVGPPMTRGPPPVPLASIPLLPLPPLIPSPPAPSLPPTLPRPPSSRIKNQQKQRQQIKPYHRVKSVQRPLLQHSKSCVRVPTHTEVQPNFQTQLRPPSLVARSVPSEARPPAGRFNGLGGESLDYGYDDTQVKSQEKSEGFIDPNRDFDGISCGLQMKMSELDHDISVTTNTRSATDPQSVWSTVFEMCPQFLVLDPATHGYY
ncbi:unnamed protein product [Phytophthora fragariaefolia]|uniref:Unnamed protein product n=1 Tax=Phytophthora fragariaefolia TaxID=1490495 RepID=A0A9W6YN67_9STRA|nr:unnamed protein product [Phytophthora fragariaefolia]